MVRLDLACPGHPSRQGAAIILRGHASEFGLIAPKGRCNITDLLAAVAADAEIPPIAKALMALPGPEIDRLDATIKAIEVQVHAMHKLNEVSQLQAGVPGIGPIIALTMTLEIGASAFESGRHPAAWLGLTPGEHSTAGKQRMGGISRAGHERLRALLVNGAMW